MNDNNSHIELRSEQSRRFLKAKTSFCIRWGTTIIAVVMLIVAFICWSIGIIELTDG